MGLLDSIKQRVSNTISSAKETVTETVQKVEKKAVELGHGAASGFDPRPSAPPPPAAPAVSGNPTVSARSVAAGPSAMRAALDGSLVKNDQATAAAPQGTDAEQAAEALKKKHTTWKGLDEEALGKELAQMAEKNPAAAAATVRAVMNKLDDGDKDDVAQAFANSISKDKARELAMTPDGREAMKTMAKELRSGWDTDDERMQAFKLDTALGEATAPEHHGKAVEIAGAATYETRGNTSYDLKDPAQRKALIENSPQLDNLAGTGTDPTRCGGASMLNGMLLDGNSEGNAKAIRTILEKKEVQANLTPPASDAEKAALDAMQKGNMTPTHAAHLQELLFRMAATPRATDEGRDQFQRTAVTPNTGGKAGLTPNGVAALAQELREHGAFANSRSVEFRGALGGNNHWTVVVTPRSGEPLEANSFPDAKTGKGAVTAPGEAKGNRVDLKITNTDDGKVVFETSGTAGGKQYPKASSDPRSPGAYYDWPQQLWEFSHQKLE